MNTYHGDIFYIANDGRAGETPAIIVSPDTWLEQDPEFVQAILMTTKENEQLMLLRYGAMIRKTKTLCTQRLWQN